jgi:hypothetical protein
MEIEALLDNALQGEAARTARAHLAACGDCARRAQAQAALFTALESWVDSPPPHDLAPAIMGRLAHRAIPVGLSVATAVQAGLALLIVILAWPLVASLTSAIPLPLIPGVEGGLTEALAEQAGVLMTAAQGTLQPLLDSADAWLRQAPQLIALSPAVIAGALLFAVLGNSILLAGGASGRTTSRPRRL